MTREKRITVRLTDEQFEEIEILRGGIAKSEFLYLILLDYLDRKQELMRKFQRIHAVLLN